MRITHPMTIRLSLLAIFLTLMCCAHGLADQTYREKITPEGKIVSGLTAEEALEKYGLPVSVKDKLWYYGGPDRLYVYLERPLGVYLYPRFYKGYVGLPLEIKVFAGTEEISDVTSQAKLLLSRPDKLEIEGEGVVVPKQTGDYQIIAIYKGRRSNASFISVTEAKKERKEEDRLLSLDIIPYKPYANVEARLDFFAFATFITKNGFILKDVTNQAEWFAERDNIITKLRNSRVVLVSPGKFRVFCTYKDLESLPQDVEVITRPIKQYRTLKHISIMPAYVPAALRDKIPLRAFATYEDNTIKEVTNLVNWQINDEEILRRQANIFIPKSLGISEVYATLKGVRSLAAKFVISSLSVSDEYLEKLQKKKKARKPRSPEKNIGELLENVEDIKDSIKDLKDKLIKEETFRHINVVPDYCDMRVGEEKQLFAFAIGQDNKEEDITILGEWEEGNGDVAVVKKGLVKAISPGETMVYLRYKDLESPKVPVIVGEPKLTSISISPPHLKLVRGEQSDFKAEGHFSDSSHRDITSLASWLSSNAAIARLNKNKVKSVRPGRAKIYAEHSGVQSQAAEIEVIRERFWLLKLIAKIAFFLFLACLLLYYYFYTLTAITRKNILKLYDNPREYVIALYGNLIKVMGIFGRRKNLYTPPLSFAKSVDKGYAIEGEAFFKFTERFEEAKYSTHSFPPEASSLAQADYNRILEVVFLQYKKRSLLFRYFMGLINKVPFFIQRPIPVKA